MNEQINTERPVGSRRRAAIVLTNSSNNDVARIAHGMIGIAGL
jgi:hypothetical protein